MCKVPQSGCPAVAYYPPGDTGYLIRCGCVSPHKAAPNLTLDSRRLTQRSCSHGHRRAQSLDRSMGKGYAFHARSRIGFFSTTKLESSAFATLQVERSGSFAIATN